MKFARYLEETQTPEWKKAYIDYRGLKKCITRIRLVQQQLEDGSTSFAQPATPVVDTEEVHTRSSHLEHGAKHTLSPKESLTDVEQEGYEQDKEGEHSEDSAVHPTEPSHEVAKGAIVRRPVAELSSGTPSAPEPHFLDSPGSPAHDTSPDGEAEPPPSPTSSRGAPQRPGNLLRTATLNMGFLPRLRRKGTTAKEYWDTSRKSGKEGIQWDLAKSIPLKDLLPLLSSVQRAFFEKLNLELDKVETFFLEREKEMRHRTSTLKAQLQELQDHRRLFHEAHDAEHSWLPPLIRRKALPALQKAAPPPVAARKRRAFKADTGSRGHSPVRADGMSHDTLYEVPHEADSASPHFGTLPPLAEHTGHETSDETVASTVVGHGEGEASGSASASAAEDAAHALKGWKRVRYNFERHNVAKPVSSPEASPREHPLKHDPDDYLQAKKKLKKAVLECYRGLELLENYRTLNLIGFRKALKKFEKYTRIPAQQAYFTEKIEPSAFSSGATVQSMLRDMEELYAARFTSGDNKLAKNRLRGLAQHKTHHFSTFRTGFLLGLALPALVDGLYRSFQPDTRHAIPGYDGLLFVYSIFIIPVVFSLLVGMNILVWSRSRINYVFIFELDIKTKLDHREYFEIPAFLLSTLCYAFWLSFACVGSRHFSPTLWPLIWLILVVVVLFNPLPLLFKPSRFWLLRNLFRLLTSGVHRVEFADFWMGDQFCSLVFTLSNLYVVGCAYSRGFDEHWSQCIGTKNWGVPFVIGTLPFLARLVQSIRRYADSKLITHLINGGKYGTGMIYYIMYFNWRHQGGARGYSFVLWCIFGTLYAIYASAWDLLMDWSVLRPRAPHPLLRPELIYTNNIPLYYFAIVTNVLIRFIWVFYIPVRGPNFIWRTFIAGTLEMLRRLQWNVYRLENEHLGNMDQYRVTREVPLPYTFDDQTRETDGDEDDRKSVSSWRSRRKGPKTKTPPSGLKGDASAAEVHEDI